MGSIWPTMKKVIHIIIGWGKKLELLPTSEAEKKLSQLRLSICVNCPFAKVSKVLELINDSADFVDTLVCEKCKCPCETKSLVVSEKCPFNKW